MICGCILFFRQRLQPIQGFFRGVLAGSGAVSGVLGEMFGARFREGSGSAYWKVRAMLWFQDVIAVVVIVVLAGYGYRLVVVSGCGSFWWWWWWWKW